MPDRALLTAPPRFDRQVRYAFRVSNETSNVIEGAQFWVRAPVRKLGPQQCVRVETSPAHDLSPERAEGQVLRFPLDTMAPHAVRVVTVRADLVHSEGDAAAHGSALEPYLSAGGLFEAGDAGVRLLAEGLKADDALGTARNIHAWVSSNVRYSGYRAKALGAAAALRSREGDCTEFMTLFVALCRAAGIPARGIAGFIAPQSGWLEPTAYHNWAEFFDGDTWRIADPQRKQFDPKRFEYLAFAVLESGDEPLFGVTVEGLRAVMEDH